MQNNKWIHATNKLRLKKNQISSNKSNETLKQPIIGVRGEKTSHKLSL